MGRPKKESKRTVRGYAFNDSEHLEFKTIAQQLNLSIPDLITKAVDEFKKLKLS